MALLGFAGGKKKEEEEEEEVLFFSFRVPFSPWWSEKRERGMETGALNWGQKRK